MKRSSPFWLALILLGLFLWLRVSHRHAPPPPSPVMVIEQPVGPDGRLQRAYLDRHGRVIEVLPNDHDEDDSGRGVRREPAEGLPVPVVPGSRTTEARAEPPQPALRQEPSRRPPRRLVQTVPVPGPHEPAALLTVTGRLSATDERARVDARAKLERVLSERLAPEVPRDWKIPPGLIDEMTRRTEIAPRTRDYGTVYEATIQADFSPRRRAEIVAVYHREQVVKRLIIVGAVLAFVLAVLAAVSGYIKADEATKGYYTTRLRLAAAAGVGAAGVVIYRMLA